jgi:hypothetical protein
LDVAFLNCCNTKEIFLKSEAKSMKKGEGNNAYNSTLWYHLNQGMKKTVDTVVRLQRMIDILLSQWIKVEVL